jgi:hypothetical protein
MTGAIAHINRKQKYRVRPGTASNARGQTPGTLYLRTSAPRGVRGEKSFVHLALVRRKRSEDFALLALWHLDGVECAAKLSGDFIELIGRNVELAMSLLQAERRAPGSRRGKSEGSTGNVADPQGAHELEARQPAEIVRVPFAESRICRLLTNDRVFHDGIAEVVDDRRDRKCATESLVQK